MKCVIVLFAVYLVYRTVNGERGPKRGKPKEIFSLEVDPIEYGSEDHFIVAGSHRKVNCRVSSKSVKVNWYDPNGEIVKRNPGAEVFVQEHFVGSPRVGVRTPASVLIFSSASVEDSGIWECRSENYNLKQEVPICVIDPAVFINVTTEVTINRGRSISLTCQAQGNPDPKIMWSRNGIRITDEINPDKFTAGTKFHSQLVEGFLTIKSLEPEDAGVYSCDVLQNNTLVDDCSVSNCVNITLNVNYSPMFENEFVHNAYAHDDESVELVCHADAYPAPTYKWFHETSEIWTQIPEKHVSISDEENTSTMTLKANSSVFGQKFRCRATNRFGDAFKYFSVLKLQKPKKPSEIGVINATDSQIQFNITWDEELGLFPIDVYEIHYFQKKVGGPPREYQWHVGKLMIVENKGEKENEEDFIKITLTELEPETEYWVRIRVGNEAGISPWSSPLLVNTGPKVEEEETTETIYYVTADSPGNEVHTYGIVFAGAVVVIAIGSTIFIKRM